MSKWVHINKVLWLTVFITLVWGQWHSIKTVMIPYIGFLLKCLQAKILDSMLFLFIWSYVCFQGTSPEEKISSSPWLTEHSSLRQRLAQEGQRRADRTAHTSSQVNNVWLLIERYPLHAPNRIWKTNMDALNWIKCVPFVPVKPWARTGRFAGSTGSRYGGWSRKWRPWRRVTWTRVEHQKLQRRAWSGGGKRLFCNSVTPK